MKEKSLDLNRVYNQDCFEGLKRVDDGSIDLLLTDPPYGLSFMGKEWDKALPNIKIWKECLRVLKPGAFAFVMCIPRQDCLSRMIINLEDAGFDTEFTSIYWAYASGFPKAGNTSRLVDKRLGVVRKVIGKEEIDIGITSGSMHANRSTEIVERDKTIATSSEAKSLDGSYVGFQPKPAVEVIIVAMKPLSETGYTTQAMKNKKGIVWFDDCRVPYKSDTDKKSAVFGVQTDIKGNVHGTDRPSEGHVLAKNVLSSEQGRFPANLLVSDDVLNDGKVRKGCVSPSGVSCKSIYRPNQGSYNKQGPIYSDSGSFSRYFDIDAWWRERFKKLPEDVQKTFPFLIVPKASRSEKDKGLEHLLTKDITYSEFRENYDTTKSYVTEYPDGKRRPMTKIKNNHPTVKPIQLGSYLITLGSRENDIVLDPFCGSGSFCISAKIESRKYIGFEVDDYYCKIANSRLEIVVTVDDWL